MPITQQEADAADRAAYRTGPNVDAGLEPGAVTVDPNTAHGMAAKAARETNGATTTMTHDGVEEVRPADATYNEDLKVAGTTHVADPDAPAVDAPSAAAKRKTPNTIANTPDDVVGDPKADVQ